MKTLSDTWFAEGRIDFELKKYTLLAYLQEVTRCFGEYKLYPPLSELIFHYRNLVAFRENKKFIQEQFPKRLTGVQQERLQVIYEQLVADDELMQELEEIILFAAGELKGTIHQGTTLYELVEGTLRIQPVGLVPLDNREGYFLLTSGTSNPTLVYHYRLSFFEKHDEKYRSIKTVYLDHRYRSISTTPEHIKAELIRHRRELPNPAVYTIETDVAYPVEETLLPVAKRCLVKFIQPAA